MHTQTMDSNFFLALTRFLARVGSIISVTMLLLLFQAEILNPLDVALKQWVVLLFFPIGVIAGLVIAWWKEGLGVSVTLGSLLAFFFVYGYLLKYHLSGWAFVVFASPAFLFLLHWLFSRANHTQRVS